MNSLPKVSIIIPTFNRIDLLMETVLSIRNQTFTDWECVIVDDGGNDYTEITINKIAREDHRFKFYRRPLDYPKGASSCRNFGFFQSSGKYIQWLDDDDILSYTKLEKQVNVLENMCVRNNIVTCDWDSYWEGKEFKAHSLYGASDEIYAKDYFEELRNKLLFLPIHSFLIPRQLVVNSGFWNMNLTVNDDIEFLGRLIVHTEKIINVRECHVLYREHSGIRISTKNRNRNFELLILSYRLLHAHLKFNNIKHRSYLKWRLFKLYLHYCNTEKSIIKKHREFFKENGINIRMKLFYKTKHAIYTKLYPFYKSINF